MGRNAGTRLINGCKTYQIQQAFGKDSRREPSVYTARWVRRCASRGRLAKDAAFKDDVPSVRHCARSVRRLRLREPSSWLVVDEDKPFDDERLDEFEPGIGGQ